MHGNVKTDIFFVKKSDKMCGVLFKCMETSQVFLFVFI